jgi:predicted DNA-binding transcriptional regulator YafY
VEKLNSQERVFEIVRLLVKNHAEGMSNKEIAFELKTSEANICRDMKVFEAKGWAGVYKGKWRLSATFGNFAAQMMKSFQTAKLRLAEDEARYAQAMQ